MLVFIVIYGLDWVATVPPTAALCREVFGANGTIVFGWVFASHQIGAAIAVGGSRRHPRHDRRVHHRLVRCRGAVRGGRGGLRHRRRPTVPRFVCDASFAELVEVEDEHVPRA